MTQGNIVPVLRALNDLCHLNIQGLDNKAPDVVEITWGGQTSTIWLNRTIENYNRLNGMTLAWAIMDEADKAPLEDAQLAVEEKYRAEKLVCLLSVDRRLQIKRGEEIVGRADEKNEIVI
jgi:hypothetical protein